uniref:Uncharacterized protein n=1 Tax=Setaria viridis TaxID=4556 RepID=A0A4U6VG44_SETVI|nr:hypothetical protein SEVIR_3G315100v2 [Setaria viridis]
MILNAPLHLRRPCSPAAHHPKTSASSPTLIPLPCGLLARRACACAHSPLRHVASPAEEEGAGEGEGGEEEEDLGPASAAAVAAAIRRASNASPVRFRRVRLGETGEAGPHREDGDLAEPSADFRRLCAEQLEMFRVVVSRDAVLSVYVRPAGSYIMDQLELRRVALYPGINNVPERDTVVLVGNFSISAGLRAAEAFLVKQQKAYLVQQTSWQNNVRMSGLVEQIRGPLSNIQTLAKMLSVHMKRTEIPYDIIEDILIQGDHLKDALQQIQEAVYLTKANIVRSSEETLKKIQGSPHPSRALSDYGSVHGNDSQNVDPVLALNSDKDDMVMPMPPLWLVPLQHQDARQTM